MKFTKLKNYMDEIHEEHHIPAVGVIVYKGGQCVFRYVTGYSDSKGKRPVTGEEQFFLYSATKVITCTAAMILIEEGKISLEDEAGKFYPAFYDMQVKTENGVRKARNRLTVKALLTMTGGLNYDVDTAPLREFRARKKHENIMEEAMNAIARTPLDFEPSTHFQYSLCHDVIGGIIEKASGMRFGEFLKERIFDPLGMSATRFGYDETENPLFMEQYGYDGERDKMWTVPPKCTFSLIPGYESGGAGLVSCLDDYGKFVAMLAAGGGTADGKQILSRESIDLMRTPMLNAECRKEFFKSNRGYNYGLGVRTMEDRELEQAKSPVGEFGWDGAAGAFNFIDVENNLAMFYVQHVLGCGIAYDEFHFKLRDLVYECVEVQECGKAESAG